MERKLKSGDTVWWSGFFGADPWRPATVRGIKVTAKGQAKPTEEIEWDRVRERGVVIDLTNGYWAYGAQIAPYGA